MLKKNKEGKYGIKMTPIEPGDLTYWGSDLFKRLEQQASAAFAGLAKLYRLTSITPPPPPQCFCEASPILPNSFFFFLMRVQDTVFFFTLVPTASCFCDMVMIMS